MNTREEKISVSIVIPTLQEEEYIGEMLSKILNAASDLEIIVVDGGSTDETVEVARKFTDKVYVLSERGIGKARNYGAYKASGNIIIFMDADVDPPPDFLEKVLSTFKKGEKIVGITCNVMPKNPLPHELAFFKLYNLLLYIISFLKPHCQGKFLAVRRDAFLKVQGFNENLPCVEDHEISFRLSKIGKMVFLRDLTVYESTRRFRREGFLKVLKMWVINYIWLILLGKTMSKSWEPMR